MVRFIALTSLVLAVAPVLPVGCPLIPAEPDDGALPERGTIHTTATASITRAEVGQAVALEATADSAAAQFAWVQTLGAGVTIVDHDRASASFAAPSVETEQTLEFMVTTSDETGAVGRATARVTVAADPNWTPGRRPAQPAGGGATPSGPTADAGGDREVLPGDVVTLDGSRSTGRIATYSWRQTAGTAVTLTNAETARATFTVPRGRDLSSESDEGANLLEFALTVTDINKRTSEDRVAVRILSPSTVGPRVRLSTSFGDIVVELNETKAPKTVQNFLRYVDDNFYDGTIFHRVIPGFVVQGGGFTPGLNQKNTRDPIKSEADNGLKNTRGTIAMARTSNPDSATSQFYFNLADNTQLDHTDTNPGYTVFGRVLEGMDVVDRISHVPTGAVGPFGAEAPLTPVVLRRATVVGESGAAAPPPGPEAPAGAEPAAATGTYAETAPGEPPPDGAPGAALEPERQP